MEQKEIRLRCIEAFASMGSQSPSQLIQRAGEIEKWVLQAEEKPKVPPVKSPKVADKS